MGIRRGLALTPRRALLIMAVIAFSAVLFEKSREGDHGQSSAPSAATVQESPAPETAAEDRQPGPGQPGSDRSSPRATARAAERTPAAAPEREAEGAAAQGGEQVGATGRRSPGGAKEQTATTTAPNPNAAHPDTSAGPVHSSPAPAPEPDGGDYGGDAPGGREDGEIAGANGAATGGRQD
jgi:hypothetical protein